MYEKDNLVSPLPTAEVVTPEFVPPAVSPSMERFRGCRWRKAPENGSVACCGHRDVLPLTGPNGFDADAWCPGCVLYKPRRTPRKRDDYGDRY